MMTAREIAEQHTLSEIEKALKEVRGYQKMYQEQLAATEKRMVVLRQALELKLAQLRSRATP